MQLRERLGRARRNLDPRTLGQLAQSAVAAAISWEIALQLPGSSSQPFFAPMAAAIALNAELGRARAAGDRDDDRRLARDPVGAIAIEVTLAGSAVWQILVVTFVALGDRDRCRRAADGARPVG